ncbi:AAA family ATPase [Planctomycetota bacterium]
MRSLSGVKEQVEALVRARYPILYLVTWEEERVMDMAREMAKELKKNLAVWSATDGLRIVEVAPGLLDRVKSITRTVTKQRGRRIGLTLPGRSRSDEDEGDRHSDPRAPLVALNVILQDQQPCLYVLKDFHPHLKDPVVVRQLRDLCRPLERCGATIVLVSPRLELPFELQKAVAVVDVPVPDREEMGALLDEMLAELRRSEKVNVKLAPEDRERLVTAVLGLTGEEAERVFDRSIGRSGKRYSIDLAALQSEKKQIIRKSGLLEYFTPREGIDDIGGLDVLKDWLRKRGRAFSKEARDYGLPRPRGALILGVQGCGKSLTAKAVSRLWGLPLLRFDISRIFDRFIGSSETNMRHALQTAESIAPAILWIDEIDKAFSGTESSGVTDAGTTARIFGSFVTWLQESQAMVFTIASANSIRDLPPELLRKGRFDEIFFVDLPGEGERDAIFRIHLRKRGRDPKHFNVPHLARLAQGFSGAEIEQGIVSAMYDAFDHGRQIETSDIVRCVSESVPLSRTMREEIDALREWARDRTRPASSAGAEGE